MAGGFGKVVALSLPSGNKVKVRRGSILSLVNAGQMPSNLIGAVWQAFGRAGAVNVDEIAKDPERVRNMVAMMEASLRAVLVQPELVDGPSETEVDAEGFTVGKVNIADIPDNDKVVLFGFTQGIVGGDEQERAQEDALRRFRAGADGEAGGSGGEAVQPAAEQPAPAEAGQPAGA